MISDEVDSSPWNIFVDRLPRTVFFRREGEGVEIRLRHFDRHSVLSRVFSRAQGARNSPSVGDIAAIDH